MYKWEYASGNVDDNIRFVSIWDGDNIDRKTFDEMGANQWELVCIYNGKAVFKRIVPVRFVESITARVIE